MTAAIFRKMASMHISMPLKIVDMLDFSQWNTWNRRNEISNSLSPGLYLLALFANDPPISVNPIAQEVIYVGQTSAKSLSHRLGSFHRSATTGKHAHSGGRTYHSLFSIDMINQLYVSQMPVLVLKNPALKAYLLFVERTLIWLYVTKWKKLPACNKE